MWLRSLDDFSLMHELDTWLYDPVRARPFVAGLTGIPLAIVEKVLDAQEVWYVALGIFPPEALFHPTDLDEVMATAHSLIYDHEGNRRPFSWAQQSDFVGHRTGLAAQVIDEVLLAETAYAMSLGICDLTLHAQQRAWVSVRRAQEKERDDPKSLQRGPERASSTIRGS